VKINGLLVCLLMLVHHCHASLRGVPAEQRRANRANAEKLHARKDVAGLMRMLEGRDHQTAQEVAGYLANLGAKEALPALRKKDFAYLRNSTASLGDFAVAIALIENPDLADRRKALLCLAKTGFSSKESVERYRKHETARAEAIAKANPDSNFDRRGRIDQQCMEAIAAIEEGRMSLYADRARTNAAAKALLPLANDAVIAELAKIPSYGAEYTTLAYRCRKLPEPKAVARCIEILEKHETPMKAEAAGRLLREYGEAALEHLRELKARMAARAEKLGGPNGIVGTVIRRCERSIAIVEKAQANRDDPPDRESAPPLPVR